jgi:hypothetical protein
MDAARQDKDLATGFSDLAKFEEELTRSEEVAFAVEASCSAGEKSQTEDEAARDAIRAWLRL